MNWNGINDNIDILFGNLVFEKVRKLYGKINLCFLVKSWPYVS